jgi:hypothetical protein
MVNVLFCIFLNINVEYSSKLTEKFCHKTRQNNPKNARLIIHNALRKGKFIYLK